MSDSLYMSGKGECSEQSDSIDGSSGYYGSAIRIFLSLLREWLS